MKKYISFVLVFCAMAMLWAQKTYEIRGKVVDFHNNAPLKNAVIQLGKQITTTDENGNFLLFPILQGRYTLTVTHFECDEYSQNIHVQGNMTLSIALEHHTESIETVALAASAKPTRVQSVSMIQANTLDENFGKNIGNILSELSGVSGLKTGNTIVKPILRGLYGSRISILSDGVKLSEQEWGVEHAPSIEAGMFQKVSVVKGAGVLKHSGDATGGVVLLESKPLPAKDTLMGNAQIAGFTNGKGLKFGMNVQKSWENRWFVSSGGTYLKSGDIAIPTHTLQNTASQEQSFYLKTGYRAFEKGIEASYRYVQQNFGIFSGSHLGTASQLYDVLNGGGAKAYYGNFSYAIQNPRQVVEHHLAKVEGYRRFRHIGKVQASYAIQVNDRQEFDIRRGELNALPSLDLQLTTQHAKVGHILERERWTLETGILGEFQKNYADPHTQARRLIPDYEKYSAGAFSMLEYTLSPQWILETAIRYDFNRINAYKYYDQSVWNSRFAKRFSQFEMYKSGSRILTNPVLNFHNFSLNGGMKYSPNENFIYRLNLSRVRRMPNPAELFADGLHHSASLVERGDLGLKSETMTQINASIHAKISWLKGIEVEFSPYYYRSQNFIQQVPTGIQNSNRGAFVIWDYQQVDATLWGFEAEVLLNLSSKMQWASQYSWLQGKNITHGEELTLMMPPRLKSRLDVKLWERQNMTMGVEHLFVQRQAKFPIHNVDFDTIENGVIVHKTLDISTPPVAYHLFDVYLGGNIGKNLHASLKVSNVFNREYWDYLNRLRFFAPEMGRNIFLSFKYNF